MSCIRRQAAKAGVSVLAALLGSTVLLTPTAGAAPAVRAPMPGAVPGADGRAGVRVGGSVTEIESRREAQNALRTDRLVVIDGYRVLCAPCKAMDFVYEKYARNYPRADFYRFWQGDRKAAQRRLTRRGKGTPGAARLRHPAPTARSAQRVRTGPVRRSSASMTEPCEANL